LRIYHPLLAFVVGALVLTAVLTARSLRPSPALDRLSWWLGGFYVLQLLVGAFNVVLKAPVAMQLIHLFISDMIWIGVVLVAANALAVTAPVPMVEDSPSTPAPLAGHTI
jgi:heme a synthase